MLDSRKTHKEGLFCLVLGAAQAVDAVGANKG